METDGIPEVQLSGQESNPIVMDPALVEPLTDLNQPGDSMVPLDPEECSSEFLIPRSLVSVSVVPTVVAYTGELVRGLNAQVTTYVKSRISKGMEYPTFFPTTLDEARDNLDFPPVPGDSLLGTWTERVMSIQQHEEHSPSAFNFYHEYGITAEDNLVAFQCVQIITQDHVNRVSALSLETYQYLCMELHMFRVVTSRAIWQPSLEFIRQLWAWYHIIIVWTKLSQRFGS